MSYQVFYRSSAEGDLKALQEPAQTAVRDAVKSLADNPRPPGVKKLAAMGNAYRIRVGNYRIGYSIVDEKLIVTVIAIAERGRIYPIMKRRI